MRLAAASVAKLATRQVTRMSTMVPLRMFSSMMPAL
jgi:hypothetical protein